MKLNSNEAKQQRGFTITQMVITISIIAVVSTFGVLGIGVTPAGIMLDPSVIQPAEPPGRPSHNDKAC